MMPIVKNCLSTSTIDNENIKLSGISLWKRIFIPFIIQSFKINSNDKESERYRGSVKTGKGKQKMKIQKATNVGV